MLCRPSRAGKRGRAPRRKLSVPPCKGEHGELTTSVLDERKAGDNHQWRRPGFSRVDDWMGVWGKRRFPHWRKQLAADDCRTTSVVPRERTATLSERERSLPGREGTGGAVQATIASLADEYGGGEEHSSSLHLDAPRTFRGREGWRGDPASNALGGPPGLRCRVPRVHGTLGTPSAGALCSRTLLPAAPSPYENRALGSGPCSGPG